MRRLLHCVNGVKGRDGPPPPPRPMKCPPLRLFLWGSGRFGLFGLRACTISSIFRCCSSKASLFNVSPRNLSANCSAVTRRLRDSRASLRNFRAVKRNTSSGLCNIISAQIVPNKS